MEAVPRMPMIWLDLKEAGEFQFSPSVKQFILKNYGENPENYNEQLKKLEQLRQSAVNVTRDFEGCSTLRKYFGQLHYLQSRVPLGTGQEAAVPISWTEIFSGKTVTHDDIAYEQACILYNLGALHSMLGAMDNRVSEEGMKVSCTHFQCSAGAFSYLRDHFSHSFSVDMSHQILNLNINLMLGQAQECLLEKSMLDNRKSFLVARISAQVVDYYKEACRALENSETASLLGKIQKDWKKLVQMKIYYFAAIAHLHMGKQAEEQQKYGERLAYLQSSLDKLNEAMKLAKGQPESVQEALRFTMDVIGGKFNSAKKDNDFIYHESVPALDTLPSVKGAPLVKALPVNPTDPSVTGPDIFSKLVPMAAHEASSLYSEEKAKLLRDIMAKIESKNETLEQFMDSLCLDPDTVDNLDMYSHIPPVLMEKCAALSVRPDTVKSLTQSMQVLSGVFTDVEASLREIRDVLEEDEAGERSLEEALGKALLPIQPPALAELKRDLDKYLEAHEKASFTNTELHRAMNLHVPNLRLLGGPLENLQEALPQPQLSEDEVAGLQRMKRILGKVQEMREQRSSLEKQLRELIQQDDITTTLVTTDRSDMKKLFDEQLKKYEQVKVYIDQNMAAQENILKALTEANVQYALVRKSLAETEHKWNSTVQNLVVSYEAYEDLMKKSQEGREFYEDLEAKATRLLDRARAVCKTRDEERQTLLDRELQKKPPQRPTAPKPPLQKKSPELDPAVVLEDPELAQINAAILSLSGELPGELRSLPPDLSFCGAARPGSGAAAWPVAAGGAVYPSRFPVPHPHMSYPPQPQLPVSAYGSPQTVPPPGPGIRPSTTTVDSVHTPISSYASIPRHTLPATVPSGYVPPPQMGPYTQYPAQPGIPMQQHFPQPAVPFSQAIPQQLPQYTPPRVATSLPGPIPGLVHQPVQSYTPASIPMAVPTTVPGPLPQNVSAPSSVQPHPHVASQYPPHAPTVHQPLPPQFQQPAYPTHLPPHMQHQLPPTPVSQPQMQPPGGSDPRLQFLRGTAPQTPLPPVQASQTRPPPGPVIHTQFPPPPAPQIQFHGVLPPPHFPHIPVNSIVPTTSVTAEPPILPISHLHQTHLPPASLSVASHLSPQQTGLCYGTGMPNLPQQAPHQAPQPSLPQVYPVPPQASAPCASLPHPVVPPHLAPSSSAAPVSPPAPSPSPRPAPSPSLPPMGGAHMPQAAPTSTSSPPPQHNSSTCPFQRSSSSTDDLLSSSPEGQHGVPKAAADVLLPTKADPQDGTRRREPEGVRLIEGDPYGTAERVAWLRAELERFRRATQALNSVCELDMLWRDLQEQQERDSRGLSIAVARCYSMKNRRPDIMPYDCNRVLLRTGKDDYINASMVEELSSYCPRLIATQAPLPGTAADFWLMVYEQKVSLVVMLVSEQELEKQKVLSYFPAERGQQLSQGPITLTLTTQKATPTHVERMISLQYHDQSLKRTIIHLQFISWPELGLPDSKTQLIRFIQEVHGHYLHQRPLHTPIVVHCSSGVGRTGAFCLLYAALQELEAGNGIPDLPQLVKKMRQQRKNMLQEKLHLKFCYEAVLEHTEQLLQRHGISSTPCSKSSSPAIKSYFRQESQDIVLGGDMPISSIQATIAKLSIRPPSGPDQPSDPGFALAVEVIAPPLQPSLQNNLLPSSLSPPPSSLSPPPSPSSPPSLVQSSPSHSLQISGQNDSSPTSSAVNHHLEPPPAEHSTQGPSSSSLDLLASMTPEAFTLDSSCRGKPRISKHSFLQPQEGLGLQGGPSDDDPLSTLDPLWTLNKT